MYDLFDVTNETRPPASVTERVSNFTIQQIFNPLQSDITSVPQYRARLIQQNASNQTTDVTNLFNEYHY